MTELIDVFGNQNGCGGSPGIDVRPMSTMPAAHFDAVGFCVIGSRSRRAYSQTGVGSPDGNGLLQRGAFGLRSSSSGTQPSAEPHTAWRSLPVPSCSNRNG